MAEEDVQQLRQQVADLTRAVSEIRDKHDPNEGVSKGFARQLRENAKERGQTGQVEALNKYIGDELKAAEPSWRKDNLGVRGNPVQFQRQQILNDTPPSTVSRRTLTEADVQQLIDAGSPDNPAPGDTTPVPSPTPFGPQNPAPEDPVNDRPAGADLVLGVYHGQDVGFTNNWGILDWDEAYIYSDPGDSSPTFVQAINLTAGVANVVKGVSIYRNDVNFDRSYSGADIQKHAHRDSTDPTRYAGPAYRIYATNPRPYN